MVNTNPEKIMSRISGTQTTRKVRRAKPVRRRMRQSYDITISKSMLRIALERAYHQELTPEQIMETFEE